MRCSTGSQTDANNHNLPEQITPAAGFDCRTLIGRGTPPDERAESISHSPRASPLPGKRITDPMTESDIDLIERYLTDELSANGVGATPRQ